MNNYTDGNDTPGGMSWWWVVALLVGVWLAVLSGMGPQAPRLAPPGGTSGTSGQCAHVVSPQDVASWVDGLGGWVDYDGTTGYWRDASGSVVGHSSAEDSDVCSFVK